jgi:predicted protein tyrosine phosphatase
MEKYIDEADILVSIKKHRDSLSYDELFDVEIETSKMKLSDKTREKLKNKKIICLKASTLEPAHSTDKAA